MQNDQEQRVPTWQMNCPVLILSNDDCVTLAHGEGGRLSRKMIREHILPHLHNDVLIDLNDAAQLTEIKNRIAITTDSYVVTPLFFLEEILASWRFMERLMTWRSAERPLSGSPWP
ncbi:MAG: hypothetical protein R3C11_00120 [Planctomycetaceae bacterium]